MDRMQTSQPITSCVTWFALAVLVLTSVHHVYGAYVYHTPWRIHAAYVAAVAATAMLGSLAVVRRHGDDVAAEVAYWVFVGVTLVVPVLLIGLFEGGYNHVVKDVLYFSGAPASLMKELFAPPTYEMPDDLFFELTGVMQFVAGSLAGWFLYRLLRDQPAAATERLAS